VAINLGIDCCSKWTSVGLSASGHILSEIHLNISRRQSACLPEAVNSLFAFTGHNLCQVDRIVLNTGPGSFNGLRIGLSYGLALAASLDRPVVPVNGLEIIALETLPFFQERTLVPVLWAKRGYVYGAIFRKLAGENRLSTVVAPSFFSQAAFAETISREKVHALLILEKERHYDLFEDFHSIQARETPSGGGLSLLGDLFFERSIPFQEAKGLYLRPPDIG
jgi:tRNA threonylcarbamoyladenosine biosynthesis protein TsaB